MNLLFFMMMTGYAVAQDFDMNLSIPEPYENVSPGENLWFNISYNNVLGQVLGTIEYVITDSHENVIAIEKKNINIKNSSFVTAWINVPSDTPPGLYMLKAYLNSTMRTTYSEQFFTVTAPEYTDRDIIVNSLFDIIVTIPSRYSVVSAGSEILTSIKLINVGSKGRIDVFLDYEILDENDRSIFKKRETVAVETQANFVRTFMIPENAEPGYYRLVARMTYADGKFAESEHSFTVSGNPFIKYAYAAVSMVFAGIFLILMTVFSRPVIKGYRMKSRIHKIVKKKLK